METTTELLNPGTIAEICKACADAEREVTEAIGLLRKAEGRLKPFMEYVHILPHGWYIYEDTAGKIVAEIRRDTWRFLLQKTRVRELCSQRQTRQFEEELKGDDLPEVTELSVANLLDRLQQDLPDMFAEAMKEVFDWLRPSGGWQAQYKSNHPEYVGRKVIKCYVVDELWDRRFSLRCGDRQALQALDNVFHMLDGKGIARYPENLLTAFEAAAQRKEQVCVTPYFECRWFKNGNMHITFRRMDLVKELNRRAGASGLGKGEAANGQEVTRC